jgi:hypothetical protein
MARNIGHDLLDVPFGEMIRSMGLAIAEAQQALDETGIFLAQMMTGEYEVEVVDDDGKVKKEKREAYVTFGDEKLSLMELGFTPTFYQFVDTIIEVKISLSMSTERSFERSSSRTSMSGGFFLFGGGMRVSSVSARYASKYNYSAEGSSLLRTKLVPMPAPAVLEERIRSLLQARQADKT